MNWTYVAGGIVAAGAAYYKLRSKKPARVKVDSISRDGKIVNLIGVDQDDKPVSTYFDNGYWHLTATDEQVDADYGKLLDQALREYQRAKLNE